MCVLCDVTKGVPQQWSTLRELDASTNRAIAVAIAG